MELTAHEVQHVGANGGKWEGIRGYEIAIQFKSCSLLVELAGTETCGRWLTFEMLESIFNLPDLIFFQVVDVVRIVSKLPAGPYQRRF
jgi:hypothetical protein